MGELEPHCGPGGGGTGVSPGPSVKRGDKSRGGRRGVVRGSVGSVVQLVVVVGWVLRVCSVVCVGWVVRVRCVRRVGCVVRLCCVVPVGWVGFVRCVLGCLVLVLVLVLVAEVVSGRVKVLGGFPVKCVVDQPVCSFVVGSLDPMEGVRQSLRQVSPDGAKVGKCCGDCSKSLSPNP